ncbi:hypothetical protein Angca_000932, partial [Angiostrongylus cantonensis]
HLPCEETYEDEEVLLKNRSEWDPRYAAEIIAASLGAKILAESSSNFSRLTTPDQKSDLYESDGRRRGNSVDSSRRTMPLEPNVFIQVRDRPSVMSFRERSIPLYDSNT